MEAKIIEQSIEVLTPREWYQQYPQMLELMGRVCYKSEDRITPDSAERFMRMIMKSGHESVLEHLSLTIRFTTDRAMTHCLVRHRHCAFSQESTHYINYAKHDELQVIKQVGLEDKGDDFLWHTHMDEMARIYGELDKSKAMVKRSIFPQAMKTELVMTANIREWRHIMKIRTEKGCHPQMQDLMGKVVAWFKENLPLFVEDFDG